MTYLFDENSVDWNDIPDLRDSPIVELAKAQTAAMDAGKISSPPEPRKDSLKTESLPKGEPAALGPVMENSEPNRCSICERLLRPSQFRLGLCAGCATEDY
jgi:hypothetical protein